MLLKKSMVVAVTLAVLVALVKLGWWQLDRADHKRQLQQSYQQRASQQLQWPLPTRGDLRGYRLEVEGHWQLQNALLLDNQVLDGRIGYRYLVPLQIDANQPLLLVDLGFVEGSRDRQILPPLPQLPLVSRVIGRLLQPQPNRLADQLLPEAGTPTRIQAVNWSQLEVYLEQPVAPVLLWLEQPQQLGFERRWQPINMSPDKHQGYALQWFGLAIAWFVVVVVLWRKRLSDRPRQSLNSTI